MSPILYRFGGVEIHAYSALLVLSFIVGILFAMRRARKARIDAYVILDLSLIIFVSSIVGAHLLYAATHADKFRGDYWAMISPVQMRGSAGGSGLILFGGMLLAIPTGLLYLWWKKLPVWKICDTIAPPFAMGVFLTRIGCFMSGCCYGTVSALPWGMHFSDNSPAGHFQKIYGYQYVHPSQLYEAVWGLVMLAILLWMERRSRYDGFLFLSALMLYSVGRFFVDMTRFYDAESTLHLLGVSLSINQMISVFVLVVALAVISVRHVGMTKSTGAL